MTDTPDFNETTATDLVLARIGPAASPRARQLVESLVRHLHAVVREVEPTPAEWMTAIQFLTRTGQTCTDSRQEFILLSDILGVSMLVDAINERRPEGASESTVLGPFHVGGVAFQEHGATICHVAGDAAPLLVEATIRGLDGTPIEGAVIDIWQTGADGSYDVQRPGGELDARGRFRTDSGGRFSFRTVRPNAYSIPTDATVGELLGAMDRQGMRPAHIHFMLEAPGFRPLTTHLFMAGDAFLADDAVFGVKRSLVVAPTPDPTEGFRLVHEFRLAPAAAGDHQAAPVYSARFDQRAAAA